MDLRDIVLPRSGLGSFAILNLIADSAISLLQVIASSPRVIAAIQCLNLFHGSNVPDVPIPVSLAQQVLETLAGLKDLECLILDFSHSIWPLDSLQPLLRPTLALKRSFVHIRSKEGKEALTEEEMMELSGLPLPTRKEWQID